MKENQPKQFLRLKAKRNDGYEGENIKLIEPLSIMILIKSFLLSEVSIDDHAPPTFTTLRYLQSQFFAPTPVHGNKFKRNRGSTCLVSTASLSVCPPPVLIDGHLG